MKKVNEELIIIKPTELETMLKFLGLPEDTEIINIGFGDGWNAGEHRCSIFLKIKHRHCPKNEIDNNIPHTKFFNFINRVRKLDSESNPDKP